MSDLLGVWCNWCLVCCPLVSQAQEVGLCLWDPVLRNSGTWIHLYLSKEKWHKTYYTVLKSVRVWSWTASLVLRWLLAENTGELKHIYTVMTALQILIFFCTEREMYFAVCIQWRDTVAYRHETRKPFSIQFLFKKIWKSYHQNEETLQSCSTQVTSYPFWQTWLPLSTSVCSLPGYWLFY